MSDLGWWFPEPVGVEPPDFMHPTWGFNQWSMAFFRDSVLNPRNWVSPTRISFPPSNLHNNSCFIPNITHKIQMCIQSQCVTPKHVDSQGAARLQRCGGRGHGFSQFTIHGFKNGIFGTCWWPAEILDDPKANLLRSNLFRYEQMVGSSNFGICNC